MEKDNNQKVPRGFVSDQLFNFTFEENEDIDKSVDNAIDQVRKSFDKEEKNQ